MIRLPKIFIVLLTLGILVGMAAPVLADEAKGKIKSVAADKNEFTLTDQQGKDWTFKMDAAGKVRLADKDAKLADVKPGAEVTVTYEKKGDQHIATEIRGK